MGYYTKYALEAYGPVSADEGARWIEANGQYWGEEYNPETTAENLLEESMKWYQHEEDMRALSKAYPDTLFVLRGEGEEAGDIWRLFAMEGKTCKQRASFVFPGMPNYAEAAGFKEPA